MSLMQRRMMVAMGMEDSEVKEWELIEDIEISEPTSYIKIFLSKQYRRLLFIASNVVSSDTGNLRIMMNTESITYNSRALATLDNFLTTKTWRYTIWEVEFVNKLPIISRGIINVSNLSNNNTLWHQNAAYFGEQIQNQEYIALVSAKDGVTMNSGNIKVYGIPE